MAFVPPNDPSIDAMQCSMCGLMVTGTMLMTRPRMTECPDCGAPANEELLHEIVAEPIEAYRVWRVVPPGEVVWTKEKELRAMADAFDRGENPFRAMLVPKLAAVGVADHVWSRTEDATCNPGRGIASAHEAPHTACTCGVWALKLEDSLPAVLSNYGNALAFGKVQLWGRIIEHEVGYRAEHARPVSVTVVDGDQELCDALAREYQCEVKSGSLPPGATSRPEGGGPLLPSAVKFPPVSPHARQAAQMGQVSAAMKAAMMGSLSQFGSPMPMRPAKNIGFKKALAIVGAQQFPILAQAVRNTAPAHNPTVEWLSEDGKSVTTNYCSILRTPFKGPYSRGNAETALQSHLRDVEGVLRFGMPVSGAGSSPPRRECGGVRHFLGRDLRPGDIVRLRPLRDLVMRDTGNGRWEWLSEFSLEVRPAVKVRKLVPTPVTTVIKGLLP